MVDVCLVSFSYSDGTDDREIRGEVSFELDRSASPPSVTGLTVRSVSPIPLQVEGLHDAIVRAVRALWIYAESSSPEKERLRPSPASLTEKPATVPDVSPVEPGERTRPYRRRPSAQALESIYAELGTVTAVAAHFGVPRHTAQGWLARLKREMSADTTSLGHSAVQS